MPLIAASITVGVLAVLLWYLLPHAGRRPVETQWREKFEAGQRALEEGSFHRALGELRAAARERDRSPDSLTPEETRLLDSLLRQATLLDELLAEPLQDLLRQAATVRTEEWQHHFDRHYRGRTILFDGDLRLDKNGRLELPFLAIETGAERARPALDEVQLLKLIPLGDSQRVIFGVRLKGFGRDEQGEWAIQFEPESGTLITDATLLASWRPLLLDGETRGVLKRQEVWARGIKLPPRGS